MAVPDIRTIGVVGLGAMGAGIAQLAIEAGYETIGREVTEELGQKARARIAHFLQRKVEKELIQRALVSQNWNMSRAAEELGITRQTLYDMMKKYGLGKLDQ